MSQDLLTQIYNSFKPSEPLQPSDPAYVDCREVRGDGDILLDIGQAINFSEGEPTCQLYTGHRGVGKSTELLRLQEDLRSKGYSVVYFAADEEDIEPDDAEYTDILLACTRHILEDLKDCGNPEPVRKWLEGRINAFKDIIPSLEITGASVEVQNPQWGWLPQFAKITASVRAVPSIRQKVRQELDAHTTTLIDALNEFIEDAKSKLPEPFTDIVVIVDNLDRITYIKKGEDAISNYDDIFINGIGKAKKLNCHMIYTIPIQMVYSSKSMILDNYYDKPFVLPMIMVKERYGSVYEDGLAKMKEIICRRVTKIKLSDHPEIGKEISGALDTRLFENAETLDQICLMSGGHIRNLMQYIQSAVKRTRQLPIKMREVKWALSQARDTYRNMIASHQWKMLVQVAKTKKKPNDDEHNLLLLARSILEYRYLNEDGETTRWFDIHPLIFGIDEFQAEIKSVDNFRLAVSPELISAIDAAEILYGQKIDQRNYLEASQIAKTLHELYERAAESLTMKQDSDVYTNAIQWSSYWKMQQTTNIIKTWEFN